MVDVYKRQDSIISFGKVGPLMAADLEFRQIPAGILMDLSCEVTKLDIICLLYTSLKVSGVSALYGTDHNTFYKMLLYQRIDVYKRQRSDSCFFDTLIFPRFCRTVNRQIHFSFARKVLLSA